MTIYKVLLTSLLALSLGVSSASAAGVQVVRIHDGDTLTITTGEKVRFLQIDTPEISPAECYGAEAHKALFSIIGKSSITLESDSVSDDKDQFGRILRYVKVGRVNVNLKLVEIGAATPYFYRSEKGIYAAQFLKAAQNAQKLELGLWRTCPGTSLSPNYAVNTRA
jgi:micrococcal nuclease